MRASWGRSRRVKKVREANTQDQEAEGVDGDDEKPKKGIKRVVHADQDAVFIQDVKDRISKLRANMKVFFVQSHC